ncbi:hypothetical protein FisN_9Hh199 [Fistulifera solaris]|uniref:Uncharacterized protein n=1 Tax=Fistulifera solaris TaxID=1519565 RepID=A0A1Z5JBB4_FISSO|nr:hypothetical protein FisN_9Hh199 [Fistulifera solaris]|eukprot:GAX11108.1 hypothetical protein FisN_9Hh199 [Fistulifera solaris]
MKIALSVSFSFIVAEGLLPQMQRFAPTGIHSSAALDQQGWIPRRFRKEEEDGMVSAMAMLQQAKLELSELSLQEVPKKEIDFSDNSQSRAEKWEQTVFSAMQQLELQIEQSAQTTGERSLQFWKTTVAEPFSKWSLPQLPAVHSLETMERAVFDEMERLENLIEKSASRTGTYALQSVQAALEAIRPQAQQVKIRWTQKLVSIIRDMADHLERHVEPVTEKDAPAGVVFTPVYYTRPVSPPPRRRPGIITSFVTRMIRNVRAKWHRA